MRDRDDLNVERTDHPTLAVDEWIKRRATDKARFFDSPTRHIQRELRGVKRKRNVAQEIRQRAHVVFVTVGEDGTVDAVGIVSEIGEVGEDQIDARHVGIGEHQANVDEHEAPVYLDGTAVPTNLAEPAEEDHANCSLGRWPHRGECLRHRGRRRTRLAHEPALRLA